MQLFYNQDISKDDAEFRFSKDESRHIIKVLRKKNGDKLYITNGKGWLFIAELIILDAKRCSASIVSKSLQKKQDYNLHIAVAPTKINDRYEWFIEKATEIGIKTITPIICDHSERKVIKIERFKKILQSAMKQSLQCYLPKLNAPIAFKDFITQDFSEQKFIAHCEKTNRKSLKSQLNPKQDYIILIGPEGDFSSKEIKMALQHNYIPVTLGKTRLRIETAAIAACHSVAFINN